MLESLSLSFDRDSLFITILLLFVPVRYDYGTNTANGVLSLIRYTVGSNYALTANGTIPAGTLNVTKVTDEDGHEAYSFTDQLGRTLLQRRLNGGSVSFSVSKIATQFK